MSIERVSRYYDGPLAQTEDKYGKGYVISVFRKFATDSVVNYVQYTWNEGDTIAKIAEQFSVGSKYWWEIMDINPEITDPFAIQPGTVIRVPYGN
jgi:LysM repeat protein